MPLKHFAIENKLSPSTLYTWDKTLPKPKKPKTTSKPSEKQPKTLLPKISQELNQKNSYIKIILTILAVPPISIGLVVYLKFWLAMFKRTFL